MASLQARHSRSCALGRPWTTFEAAAPGSGCTCKPTYYVVTRHDNRLEREKIGRARKSATRARNKIQERIDDDAYEPPSPKTFAQYADEFLVGVARRSTTKAAYAVTIGYANAVFGTKLVRKLGPADVRAMLDHIKAENQTRKRTVREGTLAKHLRQLSVVLEAARVEGLLPKGNPVHRLPASQKPKPASKPPSYFGDDELPRLWPELAHREPYLYATKLAVTTGMRFGEIAGLYLADVRLLNVPDAVPEDDDEPDKPIPSGEVRLWRQWTDGEEVPTTKSGEPRTVDLVPQAVAVLQDWMRIRGPEDGLLFEREIGGHLDNDEARDLLYAAMKAAGIPRVGEQGGKRDWHSTRHTFARIVLENGALIQWVQGQLGHSSTKLTTDLYGRWSRSAQKREAEAQAGVFPV